MPNCPVCRAVSGGQCGLRLYQSQNDCPICLEKDLTMLALPCGHQACVDCLKKIGIEARPRTPNRPPPPIRHPPPVPIRHPPPVPIRHPPPVHRLTFIQRLFQRRQARSRHRAQARLRLRIRRATSQRRCGWCGHLGHTIRNCREHRTQCGCRTITAAHKRKHARKRLCRSCGKKGHLASTCNVVIRR